MLSEIVADTTFKDGILFVQEINENVQELIDSLPANLSQNLDLVKRESPEKQKAVHNSITYEGLLQRKNDEAMLPRKS